MRVFIISLFLVNLFFAKAQSTLVFSKQYDFGYPSDNHLSSSVFAYSNDYLIAGLTMNPSNNFGGIGIIKTDSLGTIKWMKQNFSPKGYRFSNNTANQMFIRLTNNNLLFTGQYPIALNYSRAVIARVNHNTGDTLWVKEYTQPGDTCYLQCSTELSDSSIISIGYKYYTTVTSTLTGMPFILKTDKNGNYKWHKYIGGSSINYQPMYQKILKLNDNDFRIIAINFYDANNYQSRIIKLDTNANVGYDVGTTGVNFSFLQDMIILQDGNYLAAGAYWSYHNSTSGATKYRKLLYKFNGATGAKIIDKKYNWEANQNGILAIQQQADGSIIASGGTGYTSPINTYNGEADLLKLDSNLDSVKTMYIKNGILNDNKGSSSFLLMPDGGFALAMQFYPVSGQQKFWLIKTDSLGCDSASCAATVGIKDNSITQQNISLFPNPSSGILNIESEEWEIDQITLTTITGVEKIREAVSAEKKQLDISNLAQGIYFVNFYRDNKIIAVKKLVKE